MQFRFLNSTLTALAVLLIGSEAFSQSPKETFLKNNCMDCHDGESKKGGLDLTTLTSDFTNRKTFEEWVKIHDRVRDGEMPPAKKKQPEPAEKATFLKALEGPMTQADNERIAKDGRAVWRRMNRYEYENALRDLLSAPWLQIRDMLPEDGVASRYNKVGEALDVSHVQMSRYLAATDYALREVIAKQSKKPESKIVRYYARQDPSFVGKSKFGEFNRSPERATFPIVGNEADLEALQEKGKMTVGDADPVRRELESMGVVASSYEPIEIKFSKFKAPASGRYKLRVAASTFWAGPESEKRWWVPSRNKISPGRRDEPVSLYSVSPPRQLRKLGSFDVAPEGSIRELDTYLLKGETIQPDAVRLFRSRPPAWHNPLAEKDGQPGVAFRWLEVEGPIVDEWPSVGQKLLFGDLPVKDLPFNVEIVSADFLGDATRLLRSFMNRAYGRPVEDGDVERFMKVIQRAKDSGSSFKSSMVAGYSAVLCSPAFVMLEEKPGILDDHALASRLSLFLWNSVPDETLRAAADKGALHQPEVLRQQTERLLGDPKSRRFVNAFLDYWLDLRKADATSADADLYPDYYLDDLLVESSVDETQAFFAEMLKSNLPASNLVASDFVMVNERLASHYGIPDVHGVGIQKIKVPADSPRGGLMTQASVLKVTANGTTTSPVLRGAWIMERVLGQPPPPPPPSVPAVEPDTRGATTIREQLAKHRNVESCNSCHAKIDPAGFALESFDVLGGFRDKYRAIGKAEGLTPVGFGKNGQPFAFHPGPAVDPTGELPDGRKFSNVRELKALLLANPRQLARNLIRQLLVYSTGAPTRFGDRKEIEAILDQTAASHFATKDLVVALVQSPLFRGK